MENLLTGERSPDLGLAMICNDLHVEARNSGNKKLGHILTAAISNHPNRGLGNVFKFRL